jgi:hypothetical protein
MKAKSAKCVSPDRTSRWDEHGRRSWALISRPARYANGVTHSRGASRGGCPAPGGRCPFLAWDCDCVVRAGRGSPWAGCVDNAESAGGFAGGFDPRGSEAGGAAVVGGEALGGTFPSDRCGACADSSTWAWLTAGLVAATICGGLILPFSPVLSTGDRSDLFAGGAKPAQTFSPTRSSSPSATLALSSLSSSRRFSSVASSSGSGRADCHCISASARTTIASRQRGYPESV